MLPGLQKHGSDTQDYYRGRFIPQGFDDLNSSSSQPWGNLAARSFSTERGGKRATQAAACGFAGASSDAPLGSISVKMVGAIGDEKFGGCFKDSSRQN